MNAIVTKLCLIAVFSYKSSALKINDRYYPYYHLAPPHGWMNDPNGFCLFNNEYHLFYQFNPESSKEPGKAHWGHSKSSDFFHWEHLPIALYPDQEYDRSGVFSGSALIENKTMYLFYTGNVNTPDKTPDHIQRQALAYSDDGQNFTKYNGNPIIMGENHQPNIRDPKVWKHDDTYYMVLGTSYNHNTIGRVLLYTSKDMLSWEEASTLAESDGKLGFMWECPDFFPLRDKWILLFSPQGIKPGEEKYRNLYQTGYIVGDFNYETNFFSHKTSFRELDHGHDFYATQTMLDQRGRRIVVAWFNMWERVYPERKDGWTGQMTIPRVLKLTKDLKLIQKPVGNIECVRDNLLYSGKADSGTIVALENNTGDITIKSCRYKYFELTLEAGKTSVIISFNHLTNKVTLDRLDDGARVTEWIPKNKLEMHIFVDRSSVEVFCGKGEVTFSSRFFPDGNINVKLGTAVDEMLVYSMSPTVTQPKKYGKNLAYLEFFNPRY